MEELFGNDLIGEFDSVRLASDNAVADSFEVCFNVTLPADNIGGNLLIHPFAELTETECPLKAPSRSYPVDMIYPRSRKFISEIELPEGCRVNHLPEQFSFSNEMLTLQYEPVVSDDDVIRIEAEMSFHKRIYPPGDYRKLRYFYDDMLKRLNEHVILEVGKARAQL